MKRSMDDLLRSTLRSRAADPSAACVDAETAAALVDGTLSARARSSAEAHIADCARCQAVLAALVRSTPAPNDPAWWRRPAIAWLVPAAAAAAAVAIWINVPDSVSRPPAQMVRDDAAATLASAPIQSTALAPAAPQAQPQIPSADDRLAATKMVRARELGEASAKAGSTRSLSDAAASGDARQAEATALAAKPAPAPPPVAAPSDARRADARTSAAPNVETVTVSGAAPNVGTVTVSGAAPVVESVPVATFRTAPSPTIISSNRVSQWRVGTTGEVQHSADGGKTWLSQATGVNATPVAGSSPSPSVCWLVGRGGLVLITTDGGQSWRRLPFPLVTDLASVRATDDQSATVVSVDGRTFTTSDSGSSWK